MSQGSVTNLDDGIRASLSYKQATFFDRMQLLQGVSLSQRILRLLQRVHELFPISLVHGQNVSTYTAGLLRLISDDDMT